MNKGTVVLVVLAVLLIALVAGTLSPSIVEFFDTISIEIATPQSR